MQCIFRPELGKITLHAISAIITRAKVKAHVYQVPGTRIVPQKLSVKSRRKTKQYYYDFADRSEKVQAALLECRLITTAANNGLSGLQEMGI